MYYKQFREMMEGWGLDPDIDYKIKKETYHE